MVCADDKYALTRLAVGFDFKDRRAQRVRVRVLVADRQDASGTAQSVNDRRWDRVEIRRQVDGHRAGVIVPQIPLGEDKLRRVKDNGNKKQEKAHGRNLSPRPNQEINAGKGQ